MRWPRPAWWAQLTLHAGRPAVAKLREAAVAARRKGWQANAPHALSYRSAVNLLDVQDLRVTLQTAVGPADALRGISFSLARGGTLGLIGESGCGKSITALALMGLLPDGARVNGSIRLNGQDLTALDEPAMCRLRGHRIGMVFQEPMTALNKVIQVVKGVFKYFDHFRERTAAGARKN